MPELVMPLAQKAALLFAERSIENARLEAELLLADVLGVKRLDLYLQHDRPLTAAQLEQFRGYVRRRLKREPLQYITGRAHFRDLVLRIDRRALIPRPETELLVSEVMAFARAAGRRLRVLDIGAGSGAIALSIAREAPDAEVVATDCSEDALALARENAQRVGVSIELRAGDLWSVAQAGERFDVVVSNPPYVADPERDSLMPEVREWEPAGALFGGADGLAVLRPLIAGVPAHTKPGALVALEVGITQAAEVSRLLAETASFEAIRTVRDLAGRDRIVTAIRRKRDG